MTSLHEPSETVVIDVTNADISAGVPVSGCHCPIALAVARALPSQRIHIIRGWLQIFPRVAGDRIEQIKLPARANDFIDRFDVRMPVQPFSFSIEVPRRSFAQWSVA